MDGIGLLIPLLTGVVGGSLAGLLTGERNPMAAGDFLAPWVVFVVYGGFLVECVTLLGAFAVYAHQRWGDLLRRPLRELADTGTRAVQRIFLLPAALLLAVLGALQILWGAGATVGRTAAEAGAGTVISSASDSAGAFTLSELTVDPRGNARPQMIVELPGKPLST